MDNPRALVVRHDAATRTVQFNDKLIAFAKHWGFTPRACAPYRARTKGKTENGVGYVKKNAIAGHAFASWEAIEAHLAKWQRDVANVRVHGTTGEEPITRFERDEAHRLKPLGSRPPFGSLRELTRISRQRLRRRGRHQQLLGALAIDRRARRRHGRCRRGSHPAWRPRGRRPQACRRPPTACRRLRPPRRRRRDQWRGPQASNRSAAGRSSFPGAAAAANRIRGCDWRELLMPRAKTTPDVPTDKLDAMLARLQLGGIRDQLDSLLDEAARSNLDLREKRSPCFASARSGARIERRVQMGLSSRTSRA